MITQKPISARLDYNVMDALDKEVHISGHKRNRILHDALVMYIHWVDMCRRISMGSAPNLEINDYYQRYKNVSYDYFRLYM